MTSLPGGALDPATPVGHVGERRLLGYLRSRIPRGAGVNVGIGDDAAALETGPLTLVTTDSLVEAVHFRPEWGSPHLLGRKALSVNLSDIAAMGGIPRFATVSLCLPASTPIGFVEGLYDGLLERAAEAGVEIVGGNVSASAEIVVDVTLLGQGDRLLQRAGAIAGDRVVVTGSLGAAAAALYFLSQGAWLGAAGELLGGESWPEAARASIQHCLRQQLDPSPPLAFGRALSEAGLAHAGMDVSDGLSGDLLRICEESGVSAWLDSSALPVDPAAARLEKEGGENGFSLALHGGEDYQMLLAVPAHNLEPIRALAGVWGVTLSVVGEFAAGNPGVSVRFGESLRRLKPRSHDHFVDPLRERRSDPTREA